MKFDLSVEERVGSRRKNDAQDRAGPLRLEYMGAERLVSDVVSMLGLKTNRFRGYGNI